MAFFAMQVRVGSEDRFVRGARGRTEIGGSALVWPRRRLRIRKGGTWRDSISPVFPGYLFVRTDGADGALLQCLRTLPGFIRFLPDNASVHPLDQRDAATLSSLIACGGVVDRSLVTFDEERRIRVVSGPLRGMEGMIVAVDRRKGRARVRLALYEDSFEVDFGFQSLEAAPAEALAARA